MTCVFMRKQKHRHRETEADTGVICLQAEQGQGSLEITKARERQGRVLPITVSESMTLLTS